MYKLYIIGDVTESGTLISTGVYLLNSADVFLEQNIGISLWQSIHTAVCIDNGNVMQRHTIDLCIDVVPAEIS